MGTVTGMYFFTTTNGWRFKPASYFPGEVWGHLARNHSNSGFGTIWWPGKEASCWWYLVTWGESQIQENGTMNFQQTQVWKPTYPLVNKHGNGKMHLLKMYSLLILLVIFPCHVTGVYQSFVTKNRASTLFVKWFVGTKPSLKLWPHW